MASKRFLRLYDALPADAQHLLVQRHLAPLLDTVPKDRQKRVVAAAHDMHARYARMPALDLKAKKAEIADLLLELARDAKRSLVKERSRREQLFFEAVDSIARWLNDIWKVVFEFRTNYTLAHACLLYACDALCQIENRCGGCKCSYSNMFVPVQIKRSTGKVVKSFMLNGAHKLEKVALWIWRDLFMAILATGSKHQRSTVPDMIDDIRILLGWRALELLLHGGSNPRAEQDPDDDDELEEMEAPQDTRERLHIVDDDGDQNYTSEECSVACDEDLCPENLYAPHWSWRITNQQPRLRDLVHNALLDIFKVAPTGPLYSTLMAISEDEEALDEELHPLIMSVAGHSSENFSSALRILALKSRTDCVDNLLKAHQHLLRPQDAPALQFAVLIMSSNFFYRAHATTIVEEELLDVSRVFRAAVRFSFCNIESESNKAELTRIIALPESLNRRNRAERWVKGILTPQADMTHPMALAALMMGIPLPQRTGGNDEGDMLGYFEIDGDDPEIEDLQEEFRPNIKARLQGWVETAVAIKGGPALLMRVYTKVIGDMPFLKAKEVVDDMSLRMGERPSKHHVSDALEAFRDFCEKQRVRVARSKAKAARARTAGTNAHG